MNEHGLVGCFLVIVILLTLGYSILFAFKNATDPEPEPVYHYKEQRCTMHRAVDVNGKPHLILLCTEGNYILDPEYGQP